MSETPNTIRLVIPKARIAADLKGLARHLSEAAIHSVLLQDWSSVVASLSRAADAVKVKRDEGELAWQLLLTGIGEALTELANLQPPTLVNQADVDIIVERVGREATDSLVPVDFLDRPWNLRPVALAKNTLLKWLAPPADTPLQQDLANLSRRFDSALVLGLRRVIRRDEPRYRPVLALREDPTAPAWQVLEDWRLYRSRLVAAFSAAPVFDESFALDQIYVPINAWYGVKVERDAKTDKKERRRVTRLTDDMSAWLRGERGSARLRLISGGPGSGKSSAMKALAADLAQNGNNGRPTDVLLFPLQRFQWRTGIIESVAATLTAYSDHMRHNPLDPDHLRDRHTPLLLIFDGLDELTASTEASEAISATFLRELSSALRAWGDRPVWAIVTGRDAIFGNVEGPTVALPGQRFNLLPFHVREHEPDAHDRSEYHDPDRLLLIDNRIDAFRRFAAAKGDPSADPPKAYANDDLHDISAQPLLNYFLLTSGSNATVDGNLARIYSHLFQRLHARNRNVDSLPQDAGKPGAGLSQDVFDRVFEAMAVAAWRTGGTRAASWEEVLAEVNREDSYLPFGTAKLRDVFDSQMMDSGARRPFRLAAAFFVRNEQATGIDFTHKSFADYLYARRLAKALATMADELNLTAAVGPEMLGRWEALTSEHRLSSEVRRFLELELDATVDTETLNRRHDVLTPLVERVFRDGWPIVAETRPRRAEQRSCQMEEALFIGWHAMWRAAGDRRYWRLGENTGDLLYRALARQGSAHGLQGRLDFVRSWSGADLRGAKLSDVYLFGANLRDANFENADLNASRLQNADLRRANLRDADLEDAVLTGANLQGADLRGAIHGEYYYQANLIGANLCGADLYRVKLVHANLTGGNLRGSDLREADLERANLRGSDLKGANLEGANLEGANLEGANLEGANLEGANLEGANLEGANLEGANLEGANLEGANLEGANLERANLSSAKGS